MSKHGPHQHDGIWRIKPYEDEDDKKAWGLYKDGDEIVNSTEEDLYILVVQGPIWFSQSSKNYKSTESVHLLLPWEFMQ